MTTMVVDGHNLLVRALKAMEFTPLSSHGVTTGPLLVFINALSRYVREERPDRLVVCWDGGKSLYRTGLYPQYKENRPSTEGNVERESTFNLAKEFLTLSNIHYVELGYVEADDLIAAYWRRRDPEDLFVILSNDKDFLQLLDRNVVQLRPVSPSDSRSDRWDRQRVIEEMSCSPEHIAFAMALAGDASDSIPKVPGVGMKTAVKWLQAHKWSLDSLCVTEDPKIKMKICDRLEQIRINLKLVDLRSSSFDIRLAIPPDFNPTKPTNTLWLELFDFINRYELMSVRERLVAGTLWKSPAQDGFD